MKRLSPNVIFWLVGLAFLCLAGPATAQDDEASERIWTTADETKAEVGETTVTNETIARLVDEVSPAVVNIIVAYEGGGFEGLFDDGSLPGSDGGIGEGSGFIIHPDGYILTNYHVVEDAESIRVRRKDGTEHEARVVGLDPRTDIALLRVDTERDLPVLPLGDSEQWDVGDQVVAIGNPLGLNHTVTSGIISAIGRRNLGVEGDDLYTDFIQVDVSINPGNSGGPLVGLTGEVVGINTAINRKGQGIGFAIPINMIKSLLPQLDKQGYVTRSWLGARVQRVTPQLAESFEVEEPRGALVTEVTDDSPASEADLRSGDIILEFDDQTVRTSDQLSWLVGSTGPGSRVDVSILRNGTRQTRTLELVAHPDQSRPDDLPDAASPESADESTPMQLQVKDLTESLARQLGAGSRSGVVVTDIGDDSPARNAGLRRRDVITAVDETPVDSANDFQDLLDQRTAGEVVRLKLVRGGRVVYIAFER
jgi:serine protease Do